MAGRRAGSCDGARARHRSLLRDEPAGRICSTWMAASMLWTRSNDWSCRWPTRKGTIRHGSVGIIAGYLLKRCALYADRVRRG